jgi:hypothetical protein
LSSAILWKQALNSVSQSSGRKPKCRSLRKIISLSLAACGSAAASALAVAGWRICRLR